MKLNELEKYRVIDSNTYFGFYPGRGVDSSLERLLRLMKNYRISRSITLSLRGIFYDFVAGNEETLKICSSRRELIPAAVIDPRRYINCFDEIDKRVSQGFKLFRFFPNFQRWPIEYITFYEILKRINEYGVPVMISIPNPGDTTKLYTAIKELDLPIILSGLNDAYIFFSELLTVCKLKENLYVETHCFTTPDAYELFVREVGPDKIIYGSGSPLTYIGSSLNSLMNSDVSERDKKLILRENILKLIKLS